MTTFSVRFKGLLFKTHHERLRDAGIVLRSSEPSVQIGMIKTGEPINTVSVEADSEQEALEAVEAALGIDAVNFSAWESGEA
jgi:hypothetical protein